jgi:ABC-2 type transport system permease protein
MTLENGFDRIEERGWRLGFGNLLARENRKWWGSNRWWIQSLVWLVILGSFVAMVLFVIPGLASPDGQPAMEMEPIMGALQGFFGVGAVALALGITVLMQDELITEKQLGTAEWVLSKPVSRSAFLLAKLVAHTMGMLVVMVAVPSAGVYALLAIYAGAPYALVPFLAGVGLLALHTFFYLCLALVLGVLAERRELCWPSHWPRSWAALLSEILSPARLCSRPGSCPTWPAWLLWASRSRPNWPSRCWLPSAGQLSSSWLP